MGRFRSFLWGGVTSAGVYLGARYAIDQRSASLKQSIYDIQLDFPNATHLPIHLQRKYHDGHPVSPSNLKGEHATFTNMRLKWNDTLFQLRDQVMQLIQK